MTLASAQRKCHSFGAGPGSVTPGWGTTWQLARNQAGGMDALNHNQPSPNQSPPLEKLTVGVDEVTVWLLQGRRRGPEEASSSSKLQGAARPPAHFTGRSSLESSLLPRPKGIMPRWYALGQEDAAKDSGSRPRSGGKGPSGIC